MFYRVLLFFFTIVVCLLLSSSSQVRADQYDCTVYGGPCITLTGSANCVGGKPQVTLNWNNPHNDSTFNIVYYHDGHWYQDPMWSKVSTTTIPPYGAWQDGGTSSDKDPGFLATGGGFGAKITGGIPHSIGGTGITTGYSTPDWTTTLPDCTVPPTTPPTQPPTTPPTPTPNNVTPTPTPTSAPAPTKGIIALQVPGIGLNDNTNPNHPTRQIVLYFYQISDTTFQHTPYVAKGIVTYNPTTGYFSNASFPLTGLVAGHYLVLVRTLQGSLVAQIGTGDGTGPITIVTTGGANYLVDTQNSQDQNADTTVPTLPMGDIVTDCTSSSCDFNHVYTLDWSALVDCFGDKKTSTACTAHGVFPGTENTTHDTITDLNDDGNVDGVDYTILMGNFGHFGIGQQSMNRGNPPQ